MGLQFTGGRECNSIPNASKWLFKEHTTELMPIAIVLKLLWNYFLIACKHLIGYYVNFYKTCLIILNDWVRKFSLLSYKKPFSTCTCVNCLFKTQPLYAQCVLLMDKEHS